MFDTYLTAHNTIRLYVDPEGLQDEAYYLLLDRLSIWGGADKKTKLYHSWEFDISWADKLLELCSTGLELTYSSVGGWGE